MSLLSDPVDRTSRSEVKVALFRSLFRGRDDVYPRCFESHKSGRAGYAPATLPIPFNGMASLEVDLLCADARVAVELDGAQHLADPIAYRRDRRKDQLLQEHGYLVLRFLSEDVGKELDMVLDAILRSLSNRSLPTVSGSGRGS
jgi:hypothetical protein